MKRPTQILEEDRAVSPVVGVALLIAIAVILAAVVGAVVLGLGTSSADAPQASLTFEPDPGNNNVTINHDGGQNITSDNVVVRDPDEQTTLTNDLSAGQSESITGLNFSSGDKISVVWQDPESDDEVILGSETA